MSLHDFDWIGVALALLALFGSVIIVLIVGFLFLRELIKETM